MSLVWTLLQARRFSTFNIIPSLIHTQYQHHDHYHHHHRRHRRESDYYLGTRNRSFKPHGVLGLSDSYSYAK